jgi:hypothetical protein
MYNINVIGDFDVNDINITDKLNILNKDDDIYAINKETINILTYCEKEFMKKLLILFKNDCETQKRKSWKLSDNEYDYFIDCEAHNVEIQKSKNNNTIYGVKLLEDNKLWFYTM